MNTVHASRTVSRKKLDLELEVTRSFDAPVHMVFAAWTKPDIFSSWWAPKSMGSSILSCEMDVRVRGTYRIQFAHPAFAAPMAFFGKYLEVIPLDRLSWTNDESEDGAVTTVTFAEEGGKTQLVFNERYASAEARNTAFEGTEAYMPEQFAQLDVVLGKMR
jgi:uncharacterized protein YndB with AHSA1/START domain